MSFVSCLRSIHTGTEYPAFEMPSSADSQPFEVVLDIERLVRNRPGLSWYRPERRDMWRFGALLPLDVADPEDASHIVTRGEGFTPLLDYNDHPLARKAGFRLAVKDEGVPRTGYGANPTRSFKDRGMSMVVSMARRLGLSRLAVPTQGNAGDALTEYAPAAGIDVVIVAPSDSPPPILARLAAAEKCHSSVRVDLVSGTIREAGAVVREKYVPDGYFNVATFQEPGWRIEGKKTMGLELAEPESRDGGWMLPDVIIYPTGGGTGLIGMWKAFDELEALGLIDGRRPRMVAVQADATAPLVRAFETGARDTEPAAAGKTIAAGLNVPFSIGHRRVLEIVRASGGAVVAVSDGRILAALRSTLHSKGWWICPEGAACLAVLEELLDRGILRRGASVVAFNTASLEKYVPSVEEMMGGDFNESFSKNG